ncbi:gas vesicle protein [Streptomyces telluris]|uniref:Gas vesicle protein n=1 Tax=Streptomyces telluris TaxID=2720021 RepID=A0A9X2LID4_9ACTN|nr:gas vesicle protein [Streptomyces telluris]MCQ8771889.1 gas vesicle protein [Streptomyces telluris]NJP80037.1 gas vesicle protein [Streptomyces telluris]
MTWYEDEDRPPAQRQVALVDLLDRLLSGGVVISGDLVLSVADIDLVRVSLRAVVMAVREHAEDSWAPLLPGGGPAEGGDDHAGA